MISRVGYEYITGAKNEYGDFPVLVLYSQLLVFFFFSYDRDEDAVQGAPFGLAVLVCGLSGFTCTFFRGVGISAVGGFHSDFFGFGVVFGLGWFCLV